LAVAVLLAGCTTRLADVRVYAPPPPLEDESALIAQYGFAPETVGYVLYDLESGKKVAGKSEQSLFIPASVAKVPTSVAALDILGPGHRFVTPLLITGNLKDGTLDGDLTLKGGGDPMLSPADLMALARKLKAAGIARVAGSFFIDTSLIGGSTLIEPSQPGDAGYNPGFGALALDFNRMLMVWSSGPSNGARLFAVTPGVPVDVGLAPAGTPSPPRFIYGGKGETWQLSPRAPGGGEEWLPVKEPGLYTGRVFRRLARMNGITLPLPRLSMAPQEAREIARHRSQPLINIVRAGLEFSNNLVAEMIGLAASRKLSGRSLSLKDSSNRLAQWFEGRLPGVSWQGYAMNNHSGLTSFSRASPDQMAAVLMYANRQRDYLSLLPASGWKDAMRKRLRDPASALRVWAKTGTLKYATGLAGYLFTNGNRRLVFTLFVTDFHERRRYDRAPNPEAPEIAAPAEAWIDRAKGLEEALIRRWIGTY